MPRDIHELRAVPARRTEGFDQGSEGEPLAAVSSPARCPHLPLLLRLGLQLVDGVGELRLHAADLRLHHRLLRGQLCNARVRLVQHLGHVRHALLVYVPEGHRAGGDLQQTQHASQITVSAPPDRLIRRLSLRLMHAT
eukprot:4406259-Pyramimonas_sp.AAC.1